MTERKPDGGLAEWIETLEAMGGDDDGEMLCLLLELRRHREDKPALIEQLEAAQRDLGHLEIQRDGLIAALDNETLIARRAEAELKRRDAAAGAPMAVMIHRNDLSFPVSVSDFERDFDGSGETHRFEYLYSAAPAAVKDNAFLPDRKFRECVNGLLEEAIAYAGTQQLRARLSSRLSNFVKPQHAAGVKYEVSK